MMMALSLLVAGGQRAATPAAVAPPCAARLHRTARIAARRGRGERFAANSGGPTPRSLATSNGR
jgi:hypothetical protein